MLSPRVRLTLRSGPANVQVHHKSGPKRLVDDQCLPETQSEWCRESQIEPAESMRICTWVVPVLRVLSQLAVSVPRRAILSLLIDCHSPTVSRMTRLALHRLPQARR